MPYFDIFLWWSKHLVTSTIIRCFYVTIHRRMGHNRHTVDEFGFILNHVFEGNQWILRHGFLHVFYLMCDYHHPSFDRRKRSFNHFFFSFFNTGICNTNFLSNPEGIFFFTFCNKCSKLKVECFNFHKPQCHLTMKRYKIFYLKKNAFPIWRVIYWPSYGT